MSIRIMAQVWISGPNDRGELLVLLALADFCDDKGLCWPSMAAIAKKARVCNERAARRIVARLEASGYVTRHVGGGRGKASLYKINPDPQTRVSETGIAKPGFQDRKKPDLRGHKPGPVGPPEPSRTINEPSNVHQSDVDEEFDAFWRAVPRKVGKGSARKAYAKARKLTDTANLLDAMIRYASTRKGQDAQFTAHPTTWLTQERWTDEMPATADDFHKNLERLLHARSADESSPFGTYHVDSGEDQSLPPSIQAPRSHDR